MVKRCIAGLLLAASMTLAGCAGDDPAEATETASSALAGSWVEPVPGMPGKVQGWRLYPDGRAESIGMATLLFERWTFADGTLTLSGKSIGNGQTIPATAVWRVKDMSPEALTLERGELTVVFKRLE